MKKVWNVVSAILVWAVVAVAVCMMVFTIISATTFNRNDRELFGYKFFLVLSDSMSATDFDAGDVVVVKSVDPTTLQPGDIITYTSQDPSNYGVAVTHKIRRLTVTEDGTPALITYGTTTDINDGTPVTYPFVVGKYQFRLPKIGVFFQFLQTTQGYILCILLPFLLLIMNQGLNCVRIFRQYKKEQLAELQAEREALETQRRQSEAMMVELLVMRKHLDTAVSRTPVPHQMDQLSDVTVLLAQIEDLQEQLKQNKSNGGKMFNEKDG